MPYNDVVKQEAWWAESLRVNAVEDNFHVVYTGVLAEWFPTSLRYVIDHQRMGPGGKPEYIVVRHDGVHRNPPLIVELKRPSRYNDAGKKEVLADLGHYIEHWFDLTEHNTIYGLGGIGLNWIICRMTKMGGHLPKWLTGWRRDITSTTLYNRFRAIADLAYNIS